jgi:hypothetical protein
MENYSEKIDRLLEKLESIVNKQDAFSQEIRELQDEIRFVVSSHGEEWTDVKEEVIPDPILQNAFPEEEETTVLPPVGNRQESASGPWRFIENELDSSSVDIKSNIEKFIGEILSIKSGLLLLFWVWGLEQSTPLSIS